eukprot:CAMPEP_0116129012 /NCGR_PEP_ID=MMETSP0329-20121206/7699_1 /TAXON_ID=697910 /ORGANISM="Pseudo-nitzschia arenysensis, Strain B593" /LENGTH=202 /DNA_ID=CAMNT_0003623255 /DNA_START=112 /DNA_END=721 /DNA_ORIENTATION=+
MTMPLVQRKEKHKRMLRIDNVRRTVLKSQSYQLIESKLPNTGNEYTEWLATYVQRHSEQSAAEARQRGIENDLELLDIKMQEMASRITKRATIATKTQVELSKKTINNNARWSSDDLKDVAPTSIERSCTLRIELCKDFCLDKSIGGTPIEPERRVNSAGVAEAPSDCIKQALGEQLARDWLSVWNLTLESYDMLLVAHWGN